MKPWLWVLGVWAWISAPAAAEPLSFEQAGAVTGIHGGVEVGVEAAYGFETVIRPDAATLERTVASLPLFVRVGISSLELRASAAAERVTSLPEEAGNRSGWEVRAWTGGMKIHKYLLPILVAAAGVNATLPRVAPGQYRYGEARMLDGFLALQIESLVGHRLHLAAGYRYAADYPRQPLLADGRAEGPELSYDPGDAIHYAVGIEWPLAEGLWLLGEFQAVALQAARENGSAVPASQAGLFEFTPGLRFEFEDLKAKVGISWPVESGSSRPRLVPRIAWRILGSVSWRFQF